MYFFPSYEIFLNTSEIAEAARYQFSLRDAQDRHCTRYAMPGRATMIRGSHFAPE